MVAKDLVLSAMEGINGKVFYIPYIYKILKHTLTLLTLDKVPHTYPLFVGWGAQMCSVIRVYQILYLTSLNNLHNFPHVSSIFCCFYMVFIFLFLFYLFFKSFFFLSF